MKALVFDDLGNKWTSANLAFEEVFSVPKSQDNLTKYAVKPLGFVALNIYGPSIQIRCALTVVAAPALAAAFAWLQDRKFERIAIDYYDGAWKMAVARSSAAAIDLIRGLLVGCVRCPSPPLMVKRLPLSDLRSVPNFARLYAEWQAGVAGQIPFNAVNLAKRHLGDRYVVYEQGSDGQLYFSEVGQGFNHFGTEWAKTRDRKPLTAQPDATYAAWIAAHYQDAMDNNAVRFDDLDVFATNDAGKRVRFRLKRIILPIRKEGRPLQMIGGSVREEQIDLRQEAHLAILDAAYGAGKTEGLLEGCPATHAPTATPLAIAG